MKKIIKNFANLEYLTLTNVPIRKTPHGEVYDIALSELERIAAKAIIKSNVPIFGAEVKLFRSVLGLSLTAFGKKIGYKDTTILNWEKGLAKRLSVANEVVVKLLMAEHLGIKLLPSLTKLKGPERPKKIRISTSRK